MGAAAAAPGSRSAPSPASSTRSPRPPPRPPRPSRSARAQRLALVRRASREVELRLLARSARRPGFAPALDRLIGELQAALLDPGALARRRAEEGSALRGGARRPLRPLRRAPRRRRPRRRPHDLPRRRQRAALRARAWGGRPVLLYGVRRPDRGAARAGRGPRRGERGHGRGQLRRPGGAQGPRRARQRLVEDYGGEVERGAPVRRLLHRAEHACATLDRELFEPGAERVEPDGGLALTEAAGERGEAEGVAAEIAALLAAGEPRPTRSSSSCAAPTATGRSTTARCDAAGVPAAVEARGAADRDLDGPGDRLDRPRGRSPAAPPRTCSPICARDPTSRRESPTASSARIRRERPRAPSRRSRAGRTRRGRWSRSRTRPRRRRGCARWRGSRGPGGRRTAPRGEPPPATARDGSERARRRRSTRSSCAPAERRREVLEELAALDSVPGCAAPELDEALAQLEGESVPLWRGPTAGRVRVLSPYRARAARARHLFLASLQEGEFPGGGSTTRCSARSAARRSGSPPSAAATRSTRSAISSTPARRGRPSASGSPGEAATRRARRPRARRSSTTCSTCSHPIPDRRARARPHPRARRRRARARRGLLGAHARPLARGLAGERGIDAALAALERRRRRGARRGARAALRSAAERGALPGPLRSPAVIGRIAEPPGDRRRHAREVARVPLPLVRRPRARPAGPRPGPRADARRLDRPRGARAALPRSAGRATRCRGPPTSAAGGSAPGRCSPSVAEQHGFDAGRPARADRALALRRRRSRPSSSARRSARRRLRPAGCSRPRSATGRTPTAGARARGAAAARDDRPRRHVDDGDGRSPSSTTTRPASRVTAGGQARTRRASSSRSSTRSRPARTGASTRSAALYHPLGASDDPRPRGLALEGGRVHRRELPLVGNDRLDARRARRGARARPSGRAPGRRGDERGRDRPRPLGGTCPTYCTFQPICRKRTVHADRARRAASRAARECRDRPPPPPSSRRAIDARGSDVFLEAGAGTGQDADARRPLLRRGLRRRRRRRGDPGLHLHRPRGQRAARPGAARAPASAPGSAAETDPERAAAHRAARHATPSAASSPRSTASAGGCSPPTRAAAGLDPASASSTRPRRRGSRALAATRAIEELAGDGEARA